MKASIKIIEQNQGHRYCLGGRKSKKNKHGIYQSWSKTTNGETDKMGYRKHGWRVGRLDTIAQCATSGFSPSVRVNI